MSIWTGKITGRTSFVVVGSVLGIFVSKVIESKWENWLSGLGLPQLLFGIMVGILCGIFVHTGFAIGRKVDDTQMKIDRFIERLNQCTFMKNSDVRFDTMAYHIQNAEKCVLIMSELSKYGEKDVNKQRHPAKKTTPKKDWHQVYLDAVEEVAEKQKDNKKFELLRIVIPPRDEANDKASHKQWEKSISSHSIYGPHLRRVEALRKNSLMRFKFDLKAPHGVSILVVDDRFLLLQHKVVSSVESVNSIFEGGLFFNDHSKNLIDDAKNCFEEMKKKADLFTV